MSDRMLRVNSVLREVLADEIERMSDERLEMVSVTAVDTSPDLRQAVVYIDVLETDRQEPALAALGRAASRLQAVIGTQVRMKYTPMLTFKIDPGVTGGERIDAILRELRNDGEGEEAPLPGSAGTPPNASLGGEMGDSELGSDGPFPGGGFEGGRLPSFDTEHR